MDTQWHVLGTGRESQAARQGFLCSGTSCREPPHPAPDEADGRPSRAARWPPQPRSLCHGEGPPWPCASVGRADLPRGRPATRKQADA